MYLTKCRTLAIAACASLLVAAAPTTARAADESGPAPGAEVTGDTILLGQTAAQSGPNAPTGEAKWGLDAYLKSVNARGGVHGKKLGLISYDDSYQPAQTTALVKKLVYQDQVFAIVGSIGSPTNAAVYKVLNSSKVPLLGMGSGSPIFYQPTLEYVFPAWPLYTTDGKTMGAFVKKRFPQQSVAIIYQDDSFGKPIKDGILSQIGKADMEIGYVPSQVDFSSAVIKMKAADIKVVMLATIATSGAQILNQMASLGYKPTRVLTASACGYTGIFKTIASLDGAYCTAFLPAPGSTDPKWQGFVKAMKQYAPDKPADIYAAWGWLAGEVAVAGLERIKGPVTRENFVAALNTLRDVDTIGGKLTYTPESHGGICCQFLWQAKGDHWEVVPDSSFNGVSSQ
jgi:ABC-type branched-subunit amino acid transport system substrate-binding protein